MFCSMLSFAYVLVCIQSCIERERERERGLLLVVFSEQE